MDPFSNEEAVWRTVVSNLQTRAAALHSVGISPTLACLRGHSCMIGEPHMRNSLGSTGQPIGNTSVLPRVGDEEQI